MPKEPKHKPCAEGQSFEEAITKKLRHHEIAKWILNKCLYHNKRFKLTIKAMGPYKPTAEDKAATPYTPKGCECY
jgi:hypothetical protein